MAADHLEARRSPACWASSCSGSPSASCCSCISANQQSDKVSDATRAALDDSGNLLTSPNNILVLGSDRRPGEKRGRADTIMLMRYGGGKAARLSIPRDTLVNIPGHGPSKINAAYAIGGPPLMIETIKQFLGIEVNHLVEVDFKGFPKFVDALGGVTMTFEHVHPVPLRRPHAPVQEGREPPQRGGGARRRAHPQERVRARGVRPHPRPPPAAVPGGGEGQALQPAHVPPLPVGRVARPEGDHLRHGRPRAV